MLDKLLAILSLVVLIVFMGIVLVFINEVALWIIVCSVVAMAGYDFWIELWRSG